MKLTINIPIITNGSMVVNTTVEPVASSMEYQKIYKFVTNNCERYYKRRDIDSKILIYTIYNVAALPPVTNMQQDVFYNVGGVYWRRFGDEATQETTCEFPQQGAPFELVDFEYEATRMGTAPTITSQTSWDDFLDNLWTQECHVVFNEKSYYLKQIPSSQKTNEDARFRYDIIFVDHRYALETAYFYDVVSPTDDVAHVNESTTFSFFGDVSVFVKRINAALVFSGLSSYVEKEKLDETSFIEPRTQNGIDINDRYNGNYYVYTHTLSYKQWNDIALGTDTSADAAAEAEETARHLARLRVFHYFNGNYQRYLLNDVYEYENGEIRMSGYHVVLGNDKDGKTVTSEEKLLSFENNTIYEAIQKIFDEFDLLYYYVDETDADGKKTGNTTIVVGDCQYDFGENAPVQYSIDNELLSVQKNNTTEEIVTKVTGVGGTDNIPHYYPNPTPDGWIEPVFSKGLSAVLDKFSSVSDSTFTLVSRNNVQQDEVVVNYQKENDSGYERYLKNRIGNDFVFGKVRFLRYFETDDISQDGTILNLTNGASFSFAITIPQITNGQIIQFDNIRCDYGNSTISVSNVSWGDSNVFSGSSLGFLKDGFIDIGSRNLVVTYNVAVSGSYTDGLPLMYVAEYSYSGNFYANAIVVCNRRNMQPHYVYNERTRMYVVEWYPAGYHSQQDYTNATGAQIVACEPYGAYNAFEYSYDTNTVGDFYYWNVRSAAPSFVGYTCVKIEDKTKLSSQKISIRDFIRTYIKGTIRGYEKGWFLKGRTSANFNDYGFSIQPSFLGRDYDVGDTISFRRLKYITPQQRLMPEIFYKTDGQRRFYLAKNYDPASGTATGVDTDAGEEYSNGGVSIIDGQTVTRAAGVINKLYSKDDGFSHFHFENEFSPKTPKEKVVEKDDIVPSITNVKYNNLRIDVVEEFAYDEFDDDTIWETSDGESVSGEYKHPHFFAKLRPLGFNIFDMALQDDMELSLTSGACGACHFKIKVDENTGKNPVQVWPADVYIKEDGVFSLIYPAGSLVRYVDTSNLYYQDNGTYTPVVKQYDLASGTLSQRKINNTYENRVYSAESVLGGYVGSIMSDGKEHVSGDVITSGAFQAQQQDTTNNYVWIALEKDISTFGTPMPSARTTYNENVATSFIRPKSVSESSEEEADRFVLLNIRLPQSYIRSAERELSRVIIEDMYDNNYQKSNFSIEYSRIFLAQNKDYASKLNENSVIYVKYFRTKPHRQYVSRYSYKAVGSECLPQITVDMNQTLSVFRTREERDQIERNNNNRAIYKGIARSISTERSVSQRAFVSKGSNSIISGNIISQKGVTSFADMQSAVVNNEKKIANQSVDIYESVGGVKNLNTSVSDIQGEIATNIYKKDDFIVQGGRNLIIGGQGDEKKMIASAYVDGKAIKQDEIKGDTFVQDNKGITPALDSEVYKKSEVYQKSDFAVKDNVLTISKDMTLRAAYIEGNAISFTDATGTKKSITPVSFTTFDDYAKAANKTFKQIEHSLVCKYVGTNVIAQYDIDDNVCSLSTDNKLILPYQTSTT